MEKSYQISGPSLPPDFKCKNDSSSSDSDSDSSDSGDEKSGSKQIGPEMPSGLRKRSSEADSEVYGPVIPNKKQKTEQNQSASVGPILPPGFKPSYKPSSDSESEDDIIGPRPPGMGVVQLSAAEEFEKRAERMKKKLLGQDMPEVKTRETWMTELPDSLGSSLLGMPVAKSRFGDGKKTKIDRAGWTETPQDREKRQMEGKSQFEEADQEEEFNFSVPSARDKEMEAAVEELNSKRQDSLLDLHRNKLSKKSKKKDKKEKKEKKDKKEKKEKKDKKKKKKKEKDKKSKKDKKEKKEKPAERRPFDRDMDLKANHFDNAKKNALIKRSQQLNTRFQSSGQTGQFL